MRHIILIFIISTLFACNSFPRTNTSTVETSQLVDTISTELEQPKSIELQPKLYSEIAVNFINSYVENANKMREAGEVREFMHLTNEHATYAIIFHILLYKGHGLLNISDFNYTLFAWRLILF